MVAQAPAFVDALLHFASPDTVEVPDLLTGAPAGRVPTDDTRRESHMCRIIDLSAKDAPVADFFAHGFAHLDLSSMRDLQAVLRSVHENSNFGPEEQTALMREVGRLSLPIGNGYRLRVLHVVADGLFVRHAGPNNLPVHKSDGSIAMESVSEVHVDQMINGTPVKQYLRGLAPYVFAHESPGKRNTVSPLNLMRIWIPLQQPVRPLVLLNHQTFDRERDQVGFRFSVPSLKRNKSGAEYKTLSEEHKKELEYNDLWRCLHSETQQWFFTSHMDSRTAYIFQTPSCAHTSCSLPGEDVAKALYRHLGDVAKAVEAGRPEEAASLLRDAAAHGEDDGAAAQSSWPLPLRAGVQGLRGLQQELSARPELLAGANASETLRRISVARNSVTRKSVELLCVALVVRDTWPWSRL